MCTAIAFRGHDLLYGFNLDLDPAVWDYALYRTARCFAVGIRVGGTVYYTHGVTREGRFANVPYMNAAPAPVPRGSRRERIDLLTDRYLRGKYSEADVERILSEKVIVSPPAAAMHTLLGDPAGNLTIIEPGFGIRRIPEQFAVLTNFPVLTELPDYDCPFYGKDRYDRAQTVLRQAGPEFSAEDAMALLSELRQTGQWATRVSFVYSARENAVRYWQEGSPEIRLHRFDPSGGSAIS